MGEDEGFIKIISEEKYDEIIGVVIVAPNATEMISEAAALSILKEQQLAKMIHPHPTLSEGIFEAANVLMGKESMFYRF